MQEIKITSKFKVGAEVKEVESKRMGTILAVYTKLFKVDSFNYLADISYSIKPEKGYNQFRAKENALLEVVYDAEGNAHALPS